MFSNVIDVMEPILEDWKKKKKHASVAVTAHYDTL